MMTIWLLRTSRRNRHRLGFPAVWDWRAATRAYQLTRSVWQATWWESPVAPRARRRTRRSWANLHSCRSLFHRCRIIFRRDWCLDAAADSPPKSGSNSGSAANPTISAIWWDRLFSLWFGSSCSVRRLGLADNDDDGWDVGDARLLSGLGYWPNLIEQNNNTSFFVFVMSIFLCYVLLYD